MASLYRFSIRHPKLVVAIAVLATLGIAPGALRLKIRTDGHALVPTDASAVLLDQAIREEFGIEDPLVVLIRSDDPDGVYNAHTLELIRDLTRELQQIEGVRSWNVFSLATERGDRVKPGTLIFRRFLDPLPQTPEEYQRLRDDLQAIELYTGTLVSYDGKAASILVGVPAGVNRTDFYRTVRGIVDGKGDIPEQIHVIGAPVAEALLGTHILEDLGVPSVVLGHRTYQDGEAAGWSAPKTLYELRVFIGRHIGLVPIALVVMAIVFVLSFRNLPAVALPLTEVGACLIAVFGLMGWFDVPVYLTIAVLPVILTAIGVADEVHVFARYHEQLRAQPESGHLEVLTATMAEMWVPVTKTSVTTAVGFLSFALSPISPVQAFGVFTAVGIIFCMLWSLTVIPAMLALINPARLAARHRGIEGQVRRTPLFARVGRAVTRCRYVVLLMAIIVTVVAPFGLRRIVVQDSWIDGFARDGGFYKATQVFNDQFLGTHILLVCVDTGAGEPITGELSAAEVDHREMRLAASQIDDPTALIGRQIYLRRPESPARSTDPRIRRRVRDKWNARIESAVREGDHIVLTTSRKRGSPKLALRLRDNLKAQYEIKHEQLKKPEMVRRIGELEAFIETHREEAVGGVLGTASYIATTNFMARGRKEGSRSIPDSPDRIHWLWGQYRNVRGVERLKQAVTTDYDRSLVTIFLKNANFVATARLMDSIREYEQAHLKPHGMTLEFAGDVAVSQTLIDAIVTTQVRSLLASLIGIFVVTAFLGRSLGWGVLCVLPCALAVLVNFAVMGWVGMPLGVATSMFSGMTLGIGVDYAIHLLERFRLARRRGLELEAALTDAVTATGPAIFIDALAVALGFGIMTLSQVPANARLGGLVVLSIVNCFAATLLLLPALLRLYQPRTASAGAPSPPSGAGPVSS
ncbi:MAG: MMPL family transporter [Phycisphaerales bacterium]|nr:MAG: MMPL family transporter [Phycisphaerales bacterium]